MSSRQAPFCLHFSGGIKLQGHGRLGIIPVPKFNLPCSTRNHSPNTDPNPSKLRGSAQPRTLPGVWGDPTGVKSLHRARFLEEQPHGRGSVEALRGCGDWGGPGGCKIPTYNSKASSKRGCSSFLLHCVVRATTSGNSCRGSRVSWTKGSLEPGGVQTSTPSFP